MPETVLHEFPKNSRELVRVSQREFNGRTIFDFRVFYRGEGGEWFPTKKGLSLQGSAIPDLKRGIAEIEKLIGQSSPEDVEISLNEELAMSPIEPVMSEPEPPIPPEDLEAKWKRFKIRTRSELL